VAAISEFLEEQIGKRYRLKTEFIKDIHDSHIEVLDENTRAILFRNVRELLTNVVKHAKAEKVSVRLKAEDTMVTIVVEDDGVGFDPQAVIQPGEEKGGFGLFSVQERMENLGGAFEIVSEPRKGCKVIMTAPLKTGRD
jgi:signal transduction histidine kinase